MGTFASPTKNNMRHSKLMRVTRSGLGEMFFGDPLFYLRQFNTQYVCKFYRYFKQVMGDFGPHQTIPVLTYLSPFPPSTLLIWFQPERPFEWNNGGWMPLALFFSLLATELTAWLE
jgi:hypothetical protein